MALTKYKLIAERTPDNLATSVLAAAADGLAPLGAAFLDQEDKVYLQTMAQQDDVPVLPDTEVIVANAAAVSVRNSAGADAHNGTAVVADGELTGVNLAATVAMVDNADAVTVQNSAGAAVAGAHAATVAAGVLGNVKLAATVAPVVAGNQTITDGAGKTAVATRVVTAGAVASETLAATACIVNTGNTFDTVDGGTLSVTVAAGVPTFTYTPGE